MTELVEAKNRGDCARLLGRLGRLDLLIVDELGCLDGDGRVRMTENGKGNGAEGPDIQRWAAKRKAAVVLELIRGKTTPA